MSHATHVHVRGRAASASIAQARCVPHRNAAAIGREELIVLPVMQLDEAVQAPDGT